MFRAFRTAFGMVAVGVAGLGLLHAQNPFKQYPSLEHTGYQLPADWNQPAEWVFARLKYQDIYRFQNLQDVYWTMDYPASDRYIVEGVRRLTRVQARAVEQVVELDGTDDIYNWPFLYGVEVGMLDLTPDQAVQLREYLDRGGFLMVDDFHGPLEWENFAYQMSLVFPDRGILDLNQNDQIYRVFTDVDQLRQIPSAQYIDTGVTYEKGGITPHWRGILDPEGRVVVSINHNMDLGDSVEHSDNPAYPEEFAALGFRVFINYVVYSLTH